MRQATHVNLVKPGLGLLGLLWAAKAVGKAVNYGSKAEVPAVLFCFAASALGTGGGESECEACKGGVRAMQTRHKLPSRSLAHVWKLA